MQAQRATLSPSVQNGNTARPMSAQFPESTDPMNPPFQHIDEEALFTDLHERVDYLRAFLNFTHEDVELLNDIVGVGQSGYPALVVHGRVILGSAA